MFKVRFNEAGRGTITESMVFMEQKDAEQYGKEHAPTLIAGAVWQVIDALTGDVISTHTSEEQDQAKRLTLEQQIEQARRPKV
jgi:hypothetical protein